MKDNTNESQLDELFRDQLSQANASVPPGAWEAVSSGIGASTAATTAVQSAIWMKAAIGAAIVMTAGLGYYFTSTEASTPVAQTPVNSATTEQSIIAENTTPNSTQTLIQKPESRQEAHHDFLPIILEGDEIVEPDMGQYTAYDFAHAIEEPYKTFHSDELNVNEHNGDQVDVNNSTETDEFDMTIKDFKPVVLDSAFINVPDAVTPNGDGYNDGYLIQLVGEEFVNITIYDAAGEIVFSTRNKYQAWNCTLPNGELAPVGKYFVRVEYKFKNQASTRPIISPLTLIR